MIDKKIKEIFAENYRGSEESLQKTIKVLREAGYTQMDSLKCLVHELGLTLKEADAIILNSAAWSDMKENNLRMRDDLDDYLETS
jgi:hypothetical protein